MSFLDTIHDVFVLDGNPAAINLAATSWDGAASELDLLSRGLSGAVQNLTTGWTGQAATSFQTMQGDLLTEMASMKTQMTSVASELRQFSQELASAQQEQGDAWRQVEIMAAAAVPIGILTAGIGDLFDGGAIAAIVARATMVGARIIALLGRLGDVIAAAARLFITAMSKLNLAGKLVVGQALSFAGNAGGHLITGQGLSVNPGAAVGGGLGALFPGPLGMIAGIPLGTIGNAVGTGLSAPGEPNFSNPSVQGGLQIVPGTLGDGSGNTLAIGDNPLPTLPTQTSSVWDAFGTTTPAQEVGNTYSTIDTAGLPASIVAGLQSSDPMTRLNAAAQAAQFRLSSTTTSVP